MFEVSSEQLENLISRGIQGNIVSSDDAIIKDIQNLESTLKTDFQKGLKGDDLSERVKKYDKNRVDIQRPSFLDAFVRAGKENITIIIQIGLSTLSLWAYVINTEWHNWIESIALFLLVVFDFLWKVKEIKNKCDVEYYELTKNDLSGYTVTVIRKELQISTTARNLVVGDILLIRAGERIPVDGIVIQSHDFSVNECSLTGEYEPTKKISSLEDSQINLRNVFVFSGTQAVDGSGKVLVLAVGQQTLMAKITQVIEEPKKSELEVSLSKKRHTFTLIQLIQALIVIVLYLRNQHESCFLFAAQLVNLATVLFICASSNSIFLHLTMSLAFSVKRLLLSQNLVRKLETVEKLAYMDHLLVDEQNLVENQIVVEGFWNDEFSRIQKYQELAFIPQLSPLLKESLEQALFVNNKVKGEYDNGSQTDMAVYKLSLAWHYKNDEENKEIVTIPFNSMRKRITTLINQRRVVMRGALEVTLRLCSKYLSKEKGLCDLTQELKEQIIRQQNPNKRSQAMAYRDLDTEKEIDIETFDEVEKDMIFLGFVQLGSPIKRETISTLDQFKQAGIQIKMITGNNESAATQLAKECGIYTETSTSATGSNFAKCVEEYDINKLAVLARSRPEDKLALLLELQKRGHVVGVYGDGTNDGKIHIKFVAPCLKKADIGICGGISGTEIARESSSILLLDDNIGSIKYALIFGRNLIESVKKFQVYSIITTNALLLIQIYYSLQNSQVFSILQLLFIEFVIDILASIVIIQASQISSSILKQQPYKVGQLTFNNFAIGNMIMLIIYTVSTIACLSNTIIQGYATFVFITVFNILSSTELSLKIDVFTGQFRSGISVIILLGIVIFQIITIEFGGNVLKTSGGLTIQEWLISFTVGFGSIVVRGLFIIIIRVFSQLFKRPEHEKEKVE